MVLDKFSLPGRPTDLDNSSTRAKFACSRYIKGNWTFFLSSVSSLFFFPLFGRWSNID